MTENEIIDFILFDDVDLSPLSTIKRERIKLRFLQVFDQLVLDGQLKLRGKEL